MRSKKPTSLAERGLAFPATLATQNAPVASKGGRNAPGDEEIEAVFSEIAATFRGTFNESVDASGIAQYDWQFHLPQGITIVKMREAMTSLGFAEFLNLNIRSHQPTLPFDLGAFHWQGNVRGNWYHIEFRPTGWRSSEVYAVAAHYEVDRPSFLLHRSAAPS